MKIEDFEDILYEKEENGICTITFNRPERRNALSYVTFLEIRTALDDMEKDKNARVLIMTGAPEGRAFSSGGYFNIKMLTQIQKEIMKDIDLMDIAQKKMCMKFWNFNKPVIAAINGFALGGGCEIALACDIRLASERAKFGQPEVNLGVIPGFGGTQRLPRLVGKGHANELVFSGKIIDAEEAGRIGLVNRVVLHDQLLEECLSLAQMISAKSPVAVRLSKESVNNGVEMDLDKGCAYELDLFSLCFTSSDQKEGMEAFLEKRAPKFTGK